MKMFVGVTDNSWFKYLSKTRPDEVNFWQPSGRQAFKAIDTNGLFLFKLHSPLDYIAGGGFFIRHSFLPISLAWEAFGKKNGTRDFFGFSNAIHKYRKTDRLTEPDPMIGCIILTDPFFFEERDWIPVPGDWKPNIVQGKSYDTNIAYGTELYEKIQQRLQRIKHDSLMTDRIFENDEESRYGSGYTIYPRIGQGAFRVLVTEAYQRRCAITGEKTLPVLDAAHIQPYSEEGPHNTSNGLLLRKDLHALFDKGYLTVNEEMRIEVSKRIKEDYGNGREYYAMHGKELAVFPARDEERPSHQYLRWHNEHVFLA